MRLFLVLQHLLVFISVLSLTRAQSTSPLTTSAQTTAPSTISTQTTAPLTTSAQTTAETSTPPTTPPPSTTTPAETSTPPTTPPPPPTTPAETSTPPTTPPPPTTTPAETSTPPTTPPPTTTEGITPPLAPTTQSETTTSTTTVSTIPTTTALWTAPAIFYPFGPAAGDAEMIEIGHDSYQTVAFSTPFKYFNRSHNIVYVNNNGLLTFYQPLPEVYPLYPFPTYGNEDYIAPFWTELDDLGIGRYSYQEYTSGSVLTRATQDINQYFPGRGFTASWVFVATWDYVFTWDINVFNQHSGPAITVQAVLISGDDFSFILMHYGDCAGQGFQVEAGYDTVGSTDYYIIHYDPNDGYSATNLKTTTNVGVPGRWAFLVNNGTETVIGVQMKLKSFLDLTQSGDREVVLNQIKQELVNRGVSSNFELKFRKVRKTEL